jgi:hypothetical protein
MKSDNKRLERERLAEYISKLTNEDALYCELMDKLEEEFNRQAQEQIKERFSQLREDLKKLKRSTSQ